MQNKKSPKADIGRNSSLYFAVGLALMMFLSYGTINYKVYDKDALGLDKVSMDALDEEEVPITEQVKPPPPPPPPPPAPEVIEIVEDEEEVEETIIESTESDEELEIEDIEIEEVEEDVEVPFAVIENVPVFPGCERGNNEKKRKCMSEENCKICSEKIQHRFSWRLGINWKTKNQCYIQN